MTRRCRCRPSCLTPLRPTDDTVDTADGRALRQHAQLVAKLAEVDAMLGRQLVSVGTPL